MSRPQTPAAGFNLRRQPINSQSGASTRPATPQAAKPLVSLEDWEAKAPLSDDQVQGIAAVKDKLSQRPLPEKVSWVLGYRLTHQFTHAESSSSAAAALAALSRPQTPAGFANRKLGHRARTPSGSSLAVPSVPGSPGPSGLSRADPLHPTMLTTAQQFHDHFSALAHLAEHEQDSLYRDHLNEISGLRDKCDSLIQLLCDGEAEVGEMLNALEYVEERSESLRGACEDLLEEQVR